MYFVMNVKKRRSTDRFIIPGGQIQGRLEMKDGRIEQKVLLLVNEMIWFTPLALTDIEISHRIGPAKDNEGRQRVCPTSHIIVHLVTFVIA